MNGVRKFLVVGLGNPGQEYAGTRHNIGYDVVDAWAQASTARFSPDRYGDRAQITLKGRTIVLIKPNTFMNLSGKSVAYHLEKERIDPAQLLVITDDLNLPFGTIRLKEKGSDGGHNGLKSIQETLQTTQYNRLRFGISDDFSAGRQVDYVLGLWSEQEQAALSKRLEKTDEAIPSFGLAGMAITMNTYNGV